MEVRPIEPKDREPLAALIQRIETFSKEEMQVAVELVDLALQPNNPDYFIRVAERDGRLYGYVCYGPTPMTEGTYDLYWIASDPEVRGQGVGASLVSAMEGDLRRRNARLIRIETSATEAYGPTRGFYASMKYTEECRFRDFYKVGDDLIVLAKRLR
jgi:ribosomal protein S18 acetylase RimI-like enzyme